MPKNVTVELQHDNCLGVTDFAGRDYPANERREATIPSGTAEWLKTSGHVRPARRMFGGFELPKPQIAAGS